MTQEVTITLETLHCIRETVSPSAPYLWAALVSVDTPSSVSVLSGLPVDDNVVLQSNLKSGQSVAIPPSVGVLASSYDTDPSALILVTALWQKHQSPSNVVTAAYEAFISSLQSAIQANLLELADSATQQAAITNVKNSVNAASRPRSRASCPRSRRSKSSSIFCPSIPSSMPASPLSATSRRHPSPNRSATQGATPSTPM
jgi:hypothetical protein